MNCALALVFVFTVTLIGGTQAPPAQMSGETQSAVVVHVVLQAFVPQMYGLHIEVAGLTQALLVLHVEAGSSVLVVQVAPAHCVPDGYFWQAPLPLQRPLVPQVDEP